MGSGLRSVQVTEKREARPPLQLTAARLSTEAVCEEKGEHKKYLPFLRITRARGQALPVTDSATQPL